MQQRKPPMRTCVGCGANRPKKELLRVVHNAAGETSLDPVGKKPGRGAYICPDPECLRKAKKKKALERAFEATISEEVYQLLEQELAGKGDVNNG